MSRKKKNKNKQQLAESSPGGPIDAQAGTAIWGLNRWRSDGLVQLMEDLVALDQHGLSDEHCETVRQSLERMTIHASALPDSSLVRRSVMSELENFTTAYEKWNDIQGQDGQAILQRRAALKTMRKRRKQLALVIRSNQHVLAEELDLELISAFYHALGTITTAMPDLFSNLAKAIERFSKKAPPV